MAKLQFRVILTTLFLVQVWGQHRGNNFYNNNYNTQRYTSQAPELAQSRHSGYNCPEKNGTFPTSTCDGYIECKNGIPEEKLCPDGLLFNAALGPHSYPCQYPIDVDCTGREQTQPAQPTEDCPHQYGYFPLGDAANCGQFRNCAAGRSFVFDCPEGLAWSGASYRCDWPDQVEACDAEKFLGFSCPPDARQFGLGQEEYRFFRSPNDCQRYFVCIEGNPRLYNCGDGRAFNDLINACDGVENVTGCAIPQYTKNRL